MAKPWQPIVKRKSRYIGRVLLAITLIIVLLIAACEMVGWPFLRAPAERFASQQLHRTVKVSEPFNLKLIGGIRLHVGNLWISVPDGFDLPHFVDASNVNLSLRYSDLFQLKNSDLLRIKSLSVSGIDVQLVRHNDGSATWRFATDPSKPDTPFPITETLIVKNGHATVIDPLHQLKFNSIFSTNEGSANTSIISTIEAEGEYQKRPLKTQLITQGLLPIATQTQDSPAIPSKGWIEYGKVHLDFDGSVSDLFGRLNVQGKFATNGPSLSVLGDLVNIALPTTDKFKMDGTLEKNDAIWSVQVVSAHIGSTILAGDFRYDPRPARPLLEGTLKGEHFVLADLAPAFGSRNEDGSKYSPPAGKTIPDRPLDLPSLNKMDTKIAVDIDYVDLGNAFARPISPLKADLVLDNGKLTLSNIDAHTADGSLSGLLSVDAGQASDASPLWHMDLGWKDINLEKWLQISAERKQKAKEKGKQSPPAYVTGTLNGKTKLTGHGHSTAELLGSLDGNVSLYIHHGTISHLLIEAMGLDIAQGLGILFTKDESLQMQCSVMDLEARQGVVKPKVAVIDTPVTLVLIDGNTNLARELLDLRLTAKPKNMSPFTLRSPLRVKGTLAKPAVSPEIGPIAARIAGSVALAFLNPLAALLPYIDTGARSSEPSPCKQTLVEFSNKPR